MDIKRRQPNKDKREATDLVHPAVTRPFAFFCLPLLFAGLCPPAAPATPAAHAVPAGSSGPSKQVDELVALDDGELSELKANYLKGLASVRSGLVDASRGFPASVAGERQILGLRNSIKSLNRIQVELSHARRGPAFLHADEKGRYLAVHSFILWTSILTSWDESTASLVPKWRIFRPLDAVQADAMPSDDIRLPAKARVVQMILGELEQHAPFDLGYAFAFMIEDELLAPWPEARNMLFRAWSSVRLGAYERAFEDIDRASELSQACNASWEREDIEYRRAQLEARIWIDLGVHSRAEEVLREAEEFAPDSLALAFTAQASLDLLWADLRLSQRRFTAAADLIDEAERVLADEDPSTDSTGESSSRLNDLVYLTRGVAFSEAERENLFIGNAQSALLKAIASQALPPEDTRRAGIELADLLLRRGQLAQALALSEEIHAGAPLGSESSAHAAAVRARCVRAAFLATPDLFRRARWWREIHRSTSQLEESLQGMLARWKRSPASQPGGIGFLSLGPRREVLSSLIESLLLVDPKSGTDRAIEAIYASQSLGSLSRALSKVDATLDTPSLISLLSEQDQGLLILLPARNTTHLFSLDSSGSQHYRLAPRHELVSLAGVYEQLIEEWSEQSDSRDDLTSLLECGALLTSELLPARLRTRMAGWQDLTLFGVEYLGKLAWEGLPAPDSELLLGERYALTRGLSLPLWADLAQAAPKALRDPFLASIGDLQGGRSGGALSSTGTASSPLAQPGEFEEWCSSFLDKHTLLMPEGEWDEEALFQRGHELASYAVVQFLLHGDPQLDAPRPGAFRIEGGAELLTCDEIEKHLRFSGLVVFASCGAGIGPERLGEDDPGNMGGAALRAGARCAVLSRADLPYGFAKRFFQTMRAELRRGVSYAEALRLARIEAGKVSPTWRALAARVQALGIGN